jgi:hypothetical protein
MDLDHAHQLGLPLAAQGHLHGLVVVEQVERRLLGLALALARPHMAAQLVLGPAVVVERLRGLGPVMRHLPGMLAAEHLHMAVAMQHPRGRRMAVERLHTVRLESVGMQPHLLLRQSTRRHQLLGLHGRMNGTRVIFTLRDWRKRQLLRRLESMAMLRRRLGIYRSRLECLVSLHSVSQALSARAVLVSAAVPSRRNLTSSLTATRRQDCSSQAKDMESLSV